MLIINQTNAKRSISSKYPLDTRNKFDLLQNTRDVVLDKEAKNYKEKVILLHAIKIQYIESRIIDLTDQELMKFKQQINKVRPIHL